MRWNTVRVPEEGIDWAANIALVALSLISKETDN